MEVKESSGVTRLPGHFAALWLIFAAAILLRCHQLGLEGFWVDEVFSITGARINLGTLLTHLNLDVHPPFFHVALKAWMALGFHGEAGLRLLSVSCGVVSLFFIYRFGELLYGRKAGITAAVILAFSAYHVRYSQELRDYEMLSLFSLMSFYFFEKASRNPAIRNYLGYFLSTCILVYTHTFGLLTILAENLFFMTAFVFFHRTWARPSLRAWAAVQFVLFVSVLPWLWTIAQQSAFLTNDQWLPAPKITSLVTVMKYYAGSWPLLLLAAALFAYAFYSKPKQAEAAPWEGDAGASIWPVRNHTMLAIWLLAGLLIPFIASFIRSPIFLARRMIFISIPFYLLLGWAFSVLPARKSRSAFVALYFILSFFSLHAFYQRPSTEQWREAAAFVDQRAEAADLLLFHNAFPQIGFDFYSRRPELERRGFPEPEDSEVITEYTHATGAPQRKISQVEAMKNGTGRIWKIIALEGNTSLAAEKIHLLEPILEGRKRVWLIHSFKKDPQDVIFKKISEKFRIVTKQQFRGIDIYLFERV